MVFECFIFVIYWRTKPELMSPATTFCFFFILKQIDLMLLHICSLEHVDCWRHHNAVKTSSTNLPAACMPPRAV